MTIYRVNRTTTLKELIDLERLPKNRLDMDTILQDLKNLHLTLPMHVNDAMLARNDAAEVERRKQIWGSLIVYCCCLELTHASVHQSSSGTLNHMC